MKFEFRFNKPAVSAQLSWLPDSRDDPSPTQHELVLDEERKLARLELPIRGSGRFNLVLEAEHAIKTELPQQSLNVAVDHAPAFLKVGGISEQLRTISMNETIPLEVSAADDFEITSVAVEYRINEGTVQSEPFPVEGLGTPQVNGRFNFKLAGKVKEGDSFQYRLRIEDNRNVPEAKLGPNVVYLPDDKPWLTFNIARNADPLKEQEITAQREDIRRRLEALIKDLEIEDRSIGSRQEEARRNLPVRGEDEEKMRSLISAHGDYDRTLRSLAKDAIAITELKLLGDRMQDVADQEMRNAAVALQAADRAKTNLGLRAQELTTSDDQIKSAIDRLQNLIKLNDEIANQRLDQMKLDKLAEKQEQLADKVEKESDPKKQKELAKEQQRLSEELKRLTEQSEQLKQSLEAAQAEKNQELADKARELAQKQREVAEAMNETNREAMKSRLAELAKKQRDLAKDAADLAKTTDNPRKAAQTKPLNAEKPKEAADALDKGDANDALTKQDMTIQDLDRLAKELDNAVKLAQDPREAAHQLKRFQEDLKNRTTNESLKTPLEKMPADQLKELHQDQQAIKNAIKQLSIPESNDKAKQERASAEQHAEKAAEQLANKDQKATEDEMSKARDALDRLMKSLPKLDDRLRIARDEIGQIRRMHDEISREAESLARRVRPVHNSHVAN